MSQRPIDEAHGLSPREQAIVERLEAGMPKSAIAKDLGLAVAYIAKVAEMYVFTENRLDRFSRSTRACDARYRAALAASGGMYL